MSQIMALRQATDASLAGGKASTLARLLSAGFHVPDGILLPTTTEWKSNTWQRDLADQLSNFKTSLFSVRSSATVEDGRQLSWAGQFQTYLNVSIQDLVPRIRDCANSVFAPRVRAYAQLHNVDPANIQIAVIVQAMILASVAGVAFSVDPVENRTDRIIIEAVRGLGVGLVDGTTQPDHWSLEKETGRVLEYAPSGKGKALLTSHQLTDLRTQAIAIEKFMAHPVDIEWAVDSQGIWILQARPVTGL